MQLIEVGCALHSAVTCCAASRYDRHGRRARVRTSSLDRAAPRQRGAARTSCRRVRQWRPASRRPLRRLARRTTSTTAPPLRRRAAAGDHAAAIRQYELLESALRDELGSSPSPRGRDVAAHPHMACARACTATRACVRRHPTDPLLSHRRQNEACVRRSRHRPSSRETDEHGA